MTNAKALTVLVLDDSAMVRQVLASLLSQEPNIQVITAATGPIAFNKMSRTRPDVIVLDLEMPQMDGLTFLRKVMETDPIPVVICSDQASRGSHKALLALDLGAVEIINKPKIGVEEFLYESAVRIIDRVKAAAAAKVRPRVTVRRPVVAESSEYRPAPARLASIISRREGESEVVVCIGASTGGTEALATLLAAMPPDAPGIAVVQHMPAGFTAAFAGRLNHMCAIAVLEARNGDELGPGRALIAPGDKHMLLHRGPRGMYVETADGPLVSRHRPSCDVLFKSAVRAAGERAVGVILTGMGADGAQGLLAMHEAGARTIGQDEESCVVYGMPKVAVELGAVDLVKPLGAIPAAILRLTGHAPEQ